ncbi:MAG: D-aminoacyl-tRNA deacylase [Zavarzinella sp.]
MRAVIQRVCQAAVTVANETIGKIDHGLVVLLGIHTSDTDAQAIWMVEKIANLRIFDDPDGKMNLSLQDVGGSVLLVSQFTLYGDCVKGRRPSFISAARPEQAIPLYELAKEQFLLQGIPLQTGQFGADMQVALVNDGPVTLVLDTP